MFNIGIGEVIVILLVAFVVVGPQDLPKIARGLAKGLKYIKKTIQDVMGALNMEEELQEVKETTDSLRTVIAEVNPLTEVTQEIAGVTQEVQQAISSVNPLADITREIAEVKKDLTDSFKIENPLKDIQADMKVELTGVKKSVGDAVKPDTAPDVKDSEAEVPVVLPAANPTAASEGEIDVAGDSSVAVPS